MVQQSLNTLFVATEMFPFAQTGGLGDFTHSFPKILRRGGVDIRIMIPKFGAFIQNFSNLPLREVAEFQIQFAGKTSTCQIESLHYDDNIVYFLNNPLYYDRERIYGYDDEFERFAFYSRAVLEAIPRLDFNPGIIHCNDWHCALVPFFLKTKYHPECEFGDLKTIFSIHTTRYQGNFDKANCGILDLSWDECVRYQLDWDGQINCLKTGIVYSDLLITDSPNFAQELLCEPLGAVIVEGQKPIQGILNGIDFEVNNPALDQRLFARFDTKSLQGKKINKTRLQQTLDLPVNEATPIVALISRLFRSKGLDLIEAVLPQLLRENLQFIICANGIPYYEKLLEEAARNHPMKMVYAHYEPDLAYKLYAGADMLLMPSLYEPCGTSQLVAMRYGTVPIVREVGGLADTVRAYDERTNLGNGFTFKTYDPAVLLETLRKAWTLYQKKAIWNQLVSNCMAVDSSWKRSAGRYHQLYRQLASSESGHGQAI